MKKYNILKVFPVILLLLFQSCDSYFNPDVTGSLQEDENYKSVSDITAAFLGLPAVLQEVADNLIVVSELRGDLLEPTLNATPEFWDVYRYTATNGNDLVKPDAYYKVIINCNDFIRHAISFNRNNPGTMNQTTLAGMISEALRYRAWSYLTLGKFYGKVVYYDFAMSDYNDISHIPYMPLDKLVDELIGSLKTGVDGFDGLSTLDWTGLVNQDDQSWNRMGINRNVLLAELYMWRGDYQLALDQLLDLINNSGSTSTYTLAANTNFSDWQNIFGQGLSSTLNEMISVIPFFSMYDQQHRIQYYFSNNYPNAYYLKGTEVAVNLFDSQVRKDNNRIDTYRKNYTLSVTDNLNVITKYSINRTVRQYDAPVIIYRAADVHLMIAECLNKLGHFEDAMAFINSGPASYWNATGGYFLYPFSNPMYTNNIRLGVGVRGRVNLTDVDMPTGTDEEIMQAIDSIIADEVARECAYEGKRFFTLIRMARYWDKPEILAEPISQKFEEGEKEEYYAKLMNKENWFIPYDQYNN